MEVKQNAGRSCPECGSEKYLSRGRKKIPAADGKPEALETTYRCKVCEHAWKEMVPMKEQT